MGFLMGVWPIKSPSIYIGILILSLSIETKPYGSSNIEPCDKEIAPKKYVL